MKIRKMSLRASISELPLRRDSADNRATEHHLRDGLSSLSRASRNSSMPRQHPLQSMRCRS
jgi:hypothetical protein